MTFKSFALRRFQVNSTQVYHICCRRGDHRMSITGKRDNKRFLWNWIPEWLSTSSSVEKKFPSWNRKMWAVETCKHSHYFQWCGSRSRLHKQRREPHSKRNEKKNKTILGFTRVAEPNCGICSHDRVFSFETWNLHKHRRELRMRRWKRREARS